MSFLSSFQQFARDAGSSLQESAKKLVNNVVAETSTYSTSEQPEDESNCLTVDKPALGMVKKNSSLNLHLPLSKNGANPSYSSNSGNNLLGVNVPTVVTSPATSPLRMMTTAEAVSRSREPSPQGGGRKFLGASNSGSFRRRSPAHHGRRNSSLKGFDDRAFQVRLLDV